MMHVHPVSNYILNRPDSDRNLWVFLDDWLKNQHGLTSKIRYGVPFYDYRVWLCYLNPRKQGGVQLEFLQGIALDYHHPKFIQRNRKMVKGFVIPSLKDIPMETLEEVMAKAKEYQDRSRS